MSNLKHKVPIAPLSDARWRNIEEGLFEQLDREPVSMPAVLTPPATNASPITDSVSSMNPTVRI